MAPFVLISKIRAQLHFKKNQLSMKGANVPKKIVDTLENNS